MTAGTQCDTCRAFGPSRPPGWFYLAQQPAEDEQPSIMAALFGNPEQPLTFCSVKCLADFATVRAAADSLAAPEEPGRGEP